MEGLLSIVVHQCKFEKSVIKLGRQDPFVNIKIGDLQDKTRVHINGHLEPRWDDRLQFDLRGKENQLMNLLVYHKGKFSNTFLARLDLPLATLFASQQEGVWHDLINTTVVGRVCLTVRFQGLGQPHGNLPPLPVAVPYSTEALAAPPAYAASDPLARCPDPAAKPGAGGAQGPPLARCPSHLKRASHDASIPSGFQAPVPNPHQSAFDAPPANPHAASFDYEEKKDVLQSSTCFGPQLADTRPFEDRPKLIKRVYFYNDGKHIYGVQTDGRDGSPGARHQRNQGPFGYSTLELRDNEYITSVKGGESDSGIVYLQITTNLGTKKHYGGRQDQGSPFKLYIPYGTVVVGFRGGFGERLHQVGVITAPGYL